MTNLSLVPANCLLGKIKSGSDKRFVDVQYVAALSRSGMAGGTSMPSGRISERTITGSAVMMVVRPGATLAVVVKNRS